VPAPKCRKSSLRKPIFSPYWDINKEIWMLFYTFLWYRQRRGYLNFVVHDTSLFANKGACEYEIFCGYFLCLHSVSRSMLCAQVKLLPCCSELPNKHACNTILLIPTSNTIINTIQFYWDHHTDNTADRDLIAFTFTHYLKLAFVSIVDLFLTKITEFKMSSKNV